MDDRLTIRMAYSDDVLPMVDLLAELFTIEDDFTIDAVKQTRGLELLLQNPQSVVLVAEIQNRVVGMITLQRLISTAVGEYVGIIEDVVVSAADRGKGIGNKLIQAALEEANERGWKRLALAADRRNSKAIGFYQKKGFEITHMGLMYRPI